MLARFPVEFVARGRKGDAATGKGEAVGGGDGRVIE